MITCKDCEHYEACIHLIDVENEELVLCEVFKPKQVVCKECKYCDDMAMSGLWCNHPDNRNPLGCRPNDFCNDGVRKDDK